MKQQEAERLKHLMANKLAAQKLLLQMSLSLSMSSTTIYVTKGRNLKDSRDES